MARVLRELLEQAVEVLATGPRPFTPTAAVLSMSCGGRSSQVRPFSVSFVFGNESEGAAGRCRGRGPRRAHMGQGTVFPPPIKPSTLGTLGMVPIPKGL